MAKILRPRRGLHSYATSQNIVLNKGEVFFSYDSNDYSGINRIYIGDGTSNISDLKPFINNSSVDYAKNSGTSNAAIKVKTKSVTTNANYELAFLDGSSVAYNSNVLLNPSKKAIILNGTTHNDEGISYKDSSSTYEISDRRFKINNTTASSSLDSTGVSHSGRGVEGSSTYYYDSSLGNDIKFGKYTSESNHVWPEQYWAQYSVNGATIGDFSNHSTVSFTSTNLNLIKNDPYATTAVDRDLSAIITANSTTLRGKKANPASSYENNYSSATYSPFGIDLYSPDSYPYHHHIDSKGSSMSCYYVKNYHDLYGSTYINPASGSTAIYSCNGSTYIESSNSDTMTSHITPYLCNFVREDKSMTYDANDIIRDQGSTSSIGWNGSTINGLNDYLGAITPNEYISVGYAQIAVPKGNDSFHLFNTSATTSTYNDIGHYNFGKNITTESMNIPSFTNSSSVATRSIPLIKLKKGFYLISVKAHPTGNINANAIACVAININSSTKKLEAGKYEGVYRSVGTYDGITITHPVYVTSDNSYVWLYGRAEGANFAAAGSTHAVFNAWISCLRLGGLV